MAPTDSPKRKCVAESIVRRKKSLWMSKIEPSFGISEIMRVTCPSMRSRSATYTVSKLDIQNEI
jgi:hypothetical protein